MLARLLCIALVLLVPRAVLASRPSREPTGFWHPSMVLMFLVPATLSYERTSSGMDGAGIGLRLAVRLVALDGGATTGSGYVAGFVEMTMLGDERDACASEEGCALGRLLAGARVFQAMDGRVGPHLEIGVMVDSRDDVGAGAFLGAGFARGSRAGSIGLDYRYLAGHHGRAHVVAMSYMLLLPFE